MALKEAALRPATAAPERRPPAPRGWPRLAAALLLLLAFAAAWQWTPLKTILDPDAIAARLGPHRDAWYAFPLTVVAFVLLGHLMIPVLFLVFLCGLVFGPVRGTAFALAGALASAAASFCLGRALGADWTGRLAGARARKLARSLEENGVLAVFLLRKIPAPFALVNMVAGSSRIRLQDFLLGTLLGMGPMVVASSAFGPRILGLTGEPTAASFALTGALFLLSLSMAYLVNRRLRKRRRA